MTFEDLDSDTRGIIEAMCEITGKTKEQAILALVEFGMVAMIAAVTPKSFRFTNWGRRNKIMNKVFDAIDNDEKLKETAKAYASCWDIDIDNNKSIPIQL